jgi:hypothetical protein
MDKKSFTALWMVTFTAVLFLAGTNAFSQPIWPEDVKLGVWGKISIYKGEDNKRAFPYTIPPGGDSAYPRCLGGDYLYEYKLSEGDLSKLTREMFALPYLPELNQTITIRAKSGTGGIYSNCGGEEKFKWGAGFCDKEVVVLAPQPQGPPDRIWFCTTKGDTGPIDVAVGTNSLQPGKDVIFGPGFEQYYLPVTTTQFTKVSTVCLKTIQNTQTKCIEEAYYAGVPASGECSDVASEWWIRFEDYGVSGALYTGTPSATEACDQTLEIPPQEYLDSLVPPTTTVSSVYLDVLSDKSITDTATSCACPPCIKYTIRGYLKCSCP